MSLRVKMKVWLTVSLESAFKFRTKINDFQSQCCCCAWSWIDFPHPDNGTNEIIWQIFGIYRTKWTLRLTLKKKIIRVRPIKESLLSEETVLKKKIRTNSEESAKWAASIYWIVNQSRQFTRFTQVKLTDTQRHGAYCDSLLSTECDATRWISWA